MIFETMYIKEPLLTGTRTFLFFNFKNRNGNWDRFFLQIEPKSEPIKLLRPQPMVLLHRRFIEICRMCRRRNGKMHSNNGLFNFDLIFLLCFIILEPLIFSQNISIKFF